MDRGRLTVKFDGLIHLQCSDGYLTASGIEGERLFLRSPATSTTADEALPFFSFTHSVYRIVPTPSSLVMSERAARKSGASFNPADSTSNADITYGQSFSLVHAASQLYVSVAHSLPSANDPDCMSVVLVSPEAADSPNCEFIFTSRYKIHSDGDKLCRSDDVLVRLASKPIFLHVSAPRFMESLPVNGADYAVIYQAFRRGGNLSYRKGAHHGNGPPNGQPANPETSMTLGDDMVASSECTDLALEALSREYLDEVNGCEEMGVSFILNRYDIGVDRANQQRTQLHLSRPFVACGVPIAFYHREREAFLTTSVTAPRSLARQASILDDGGDDMDKAKRKAHRRKATKPHNGVQTMNGADGQLHSVTATPSASPAASVQDGPQSGESGGLGNASFASSVSVNTYSTQQRLSHQQHATCINGLLDVGRGLRLPFPTFAAPEGESSSRLDSTLEDASCNCISLWIIEHEEPTSGGPIRLSTANYRIKHCLSGLYLAVCGSAVDELYDTEDVDSDGNYAMESRAPSSHSSNSGDEPPSKEGTHRGNNTRTPTVISQPVAAAVRETALCLVSEPRTPKDIQRTLFTVDPMFSTDCNYLIEQDCLVLKNCLTGMYVSSDHSVEGPNIRLSLQWQPSSADTIVASYVSPAIQKKTFFLRNQCLWLTKYRDHIQALAQDVHREREARRREAEEGNAEAMESERQRAEHVARLPQAAVESRQRHKWDEELMHSKRGAAAAFAEVDPNKVDPSYRCLSPTIRLCQRALCELIEFCSSSTDSDGAEGLLFKEYLPAVENQSMLYNIRLYRLLFDIIMAPFTLLSGDPTGGAAGADEPTVVGTDRCCLLQAVLGNHRISAMHGMWSVTNTFEERARLPVLPPREGLMLMDEAVLPEHAEIHLIARLAFRLLRQMTLGNSSFSNGWCDYVPHFLALDGRMLHVVETMKEMFSDNPSIPISAMQDVSQHFIDASKAIRRGAYLDFLGAACTIQFQGVPERQDFVCRKLLVEHPEALSAFRIENGSLFVQLCVDEESEVETIEFSNFFRRYKDRKHVRFVENQIGLLAKLCYDGCSDFCRREVAKVFSMEAVRIALKTFVWTGAETVGESSPQDYLRAHLLRLAQQCFIIPSIVDPDRQLRAGTMLFGASSLRPERSNYFSGHPDDDMTSLVKQVTLNLLRTNNHFCQSDVARSVLMRAAVGIWLRFARNRQYCVDEMLIIIPIFLQMLDGAEDVLEQKTDIRRSGSQRSRTSRTTKKSMPVTNEERFRYSVESVLIMKVREMVCMCLLAFLTNAMHTAADEVTVYLYESFNADAAVRRRRQQQRKPWEDGCAEGMFSMGKVHSLLEGGRSRIAGTFHAATGILVGGDDGPSEDSHSQSASHRRSDGYEAISCGGASSESHPRREGEACQSPIAADIHAYLDFLAKKIYGLYFPAKLVPLLLDVTRYQSNGLTVQAMRLMVQLCVVKRCMAQMVLQVHALPSPDIIRSFDRMHDVSVHLRQAISAEREYGPSWDVSIRTALSTLLDTEGEDEETSPTHASSDSRAAPSFNEDDLRAIYSSFALPRSGGVSSPLAPALVPPAASAEFLHSGSSSIDESLLPASPAGATNVVADPVATRPPGRASACWMRTRVATRLLIYQNTIKSRRRAMGLSEASSVPLHLIIRAEMMAHWHLHESLLAMMPKMPKDSDSYFLLMKFFYYFSLSDSNAKSLQAYIEVFINSLLENERCKVLTLNIIAAVLGTMQDINAYLTLELLTSFVQVIDREVITKIPDAAFVELLSDKIFSKTSVDAVVRRRFLLILRAHNTLYMLAHPRNSPTAVEINFTSALVNLVCNVCGSSVSVLALAQGMLPAGSICRIIIQRGADDPIAMMTALPASSLTACSMEEDTSAITDTTGFKLINPYVRALVALYFTSAEDNKDDRRRRQEQWMGDSQWWEIVQMYARLQHEVCALIGKHQHDVVNCGLTIISRYRMFFLTTIPISLSAFFINCFTTQLFDKLHRVIRNTLHDILHSCAEFGVQLMKHVDALEVSIEEIVNQRRLLGVLQYQASLLEVDSLQGVIQQCADCKGVQRMWLAEQQRILQTNLEERRAGEADEDESDDMGAFDVFFSEEAVSRQLQKSHVHKSGGGLLLSSAIANMREINQVKETLRDILQGNTIIPSIHDTPSEVALIVNAYLLRTPHKAALKESITRILTAMRDKLFLPRTIVGLLNLFYNALQSVLDPPPATSITSGLGGGCGGLTETPTKREGGEDGGGEVSPSAYKLQVVFNELGMTRVVVSLCDVENDVISFSAIRLGVAILDGGNKRVQKSLLEYFVTREEGFFHSIRNILRQNMQWVEHINSEHTYSLLKQGLSGTKSRSSANTANIQLVEALTPTIRQTRLSGDRHQVSLSGWARVKGARRIELVTAIFRLLQLFCEGHFSGMQNYIRSQHDNLHSANMVHESMSFVAELTTFITPANLELVNQGYNLLTEVCQGPCHANQEALIGYDMCGTIRHTLERLGGREATISGEEHQQDTLNLLTEEDAHQLRRAVTTSLLAIIEGCRDPNVYEKIMLQLPLPAVSREVAEMQVEQIVREDGGYDEDDDRTAALFNWIVYLRSIEPYAVEDDELVEVAQLRRSLCGLEQRLGSIEISREDGLEKVYFHIPRICDSLTQERKDTLLWSVDRTSRVTKLADFLHKSDEIIFSIEQRHAFNDWMRRWTRFHPSSRPPAGLCRPITRVLRSSMITYNTHIAPWIFCYDTGYYESLSMWIAFIVNTILTLAEGSDFGSQQLMRREEALVRILCGWQTIICAVILFIDLKVSFPIHLYVSFKNQIRYTGGKARLDVKMDEVYAGLTTMDRVRSYASWFTLHLRVFLLFVALLSWTVSPYFAAFNLMLCVYKISTLRTFITAITMNGKQLLLTSLLGIIILYLFSIVGFLAFANEYNGDDEPSSSNSNPNCRTLLQCFTFILNNGLRAGGGVGDVMRPWTWDSPDMLPRLAYDMLFYSLVTVVFLNIMFGIIIDTFGQMRDEKREKEADMHGLCFICGLDSDTLEKSCSDFTNHVQKEHNMWMYLYFMHHLRRKDPSEFTGQESYVQTKIQQNSLDFFPDENCLALADAKKSANPDSSDSDEDEAEDGGSGGATVSTLSEGLSGQRDRNLLVGLMREIASIKDTMGSNYRDITQEWMKMRSALQQMELASRSSTTGGSTIAHGAPTGPHSVSAKTAVYAASERSSVTRSQLHGGSTFVVPSSMSREQLEARVMELQRQCEQQQHHQQQQHRSDHSNMSKKSAKPLGREDSL